MSLEEAVQRGIFDNELEEVLRRAEQAVFGFKSIKTSETLSVFEAMKRVS